MHPSTRALLSRSVGIVSKYAFMIQTVNGRVNEQYASTSPVNVFWRPSALNRRKYAGIKTTVGSIRVNRSAKSENVFRGTRNRA